MPELPEVETVCRGMEQAVKGRVITRVDVRREGLRVPFPPALKDSLTGRTVKDLGRRAKYILADMDDGAVLIFHLGMAGRIGLVPPGRDYVPQKHDHLILGFDDGSLLVFNDARRFGVVALARRTDLQSHRMLSGLGPEPLEPGFSGATLSQSLKNRKTSVKAALMDQRVVAGLGNIYVCEALFMAGIDPQRPACSLSAADAGSLAQAIRDVLERAILAGGSTLRDYRRTDGELGYFQHQFAVYDRAGAACPGCVCDVSRTGGIGKITQGGRSTYYCPERQR